VVVSVMRTFAVDRPNLIPVTIIIIAVEQLEFNRCLKAKSIVKSIGIAIALLFKISINNNNNNNNEFIVRFAVRGQCRGRPYVERGPDCTTHRAGSIKTQGWGLFGKRSFSQEISPEERMSFRGKRRER